MVKKAIIHRVIREIYIYFRNRCVPLAHIVEHVKKVEPNASSSLVKFALEIMAKDGKVQKVKVYKSYTIYCFGKNPQMGNIFDYKKAEECVNKLAPSFTFMQLAECVLEHRPAGPPTPIYTAILYVLMRMVKDQKIHSFTVLVDSKDRLKVIIKK